jgi:hypothetical protein
MPHSDHGIIKDEKAQEQPTDKRRAQTAHQSSPGPSASREATRDPRLNDAEETSGPGRTMDKGNRARER